MDGTWKNDDYHEGDGDGDWHRSDYNLPFQANVGGDVFRRTRDEKGAVALLLMLMLDSNSPA